MKQWQMNLKFKENKNLNFVIGDVRDKELFFALNNVDYCIHAAVQKLCQLKLIPQSVLKLMLLEP